MWNTVGCIFFLIVEICIEFYGLSLLKWREMKIHIFSRNRELVFARERDILSERCRTKKEWSSHCRFIQNRSSLEVQGESRTSENHLEGITILALGTEEWIGQSLCCQYVSIIPKRPHSEKREEDEKHSTKRTHSTESKLSMKNSPDYSILPWVCNTKYCVFSSISLLFYIDSIWWKMKNLYYHPHADNSSFISLVRSHRLVWEKRTTRSRVAAV